MAIGSLAFRLAARSAILLEAAWVLAPTQVPALVRIPSPTATFTPRPTFTPSATPVPTEPSLPTSPPGPVPTDTQAPSDTPLRMPLPLRPTATSLPSPTPRPSITPTLPPRPTPLPSPKPPLTPVARIDPNCKLSTSEEGLLVLVDKKHGLGPDYLPPELASLDLRPVNTFVQPTFLRAPAVKPLADMLDAMNGAGLRPKVISGYRSYVEQSAAYEKWLNFDPERGPQISAPPGFSEHQLGTVVDFGSPALAYRFHTNFYYTPEGQWLDQHAIEFGWTLTYPAWAAEQTGFEWEPWHFRYVGKALAKELFDRRLTLSAYLIRCNPNG